VQQRLQLNSARRLLQLHQRIHSARALTLPLPCKAPAPFSTSHCSKSSAAAVVSRACRVLTNRAELTCAWNAWEGDVHMYAQIMSPRQINCCLQVSAGPAQKQQVNHSLHAVTKMGQSCSTTARMA
jgi:hypothetical protein